MRTSLIILDGIWGSGKTTLSIKLFQCLQNKCKVTKLFLDDAEEHPLFNTENLSSNVFFKIYCARLQAIVDDIINNGNTVIIESLIFNGLFFEAVLEKWPKEILQEKIHSLNKILFPISSSLFFFYQKNVLDHWNNISKIRGRLWKAHICQEFKRDEEGIVKLLNAVQGVGIKNFHNLIIPFKNKINLTNNGWEAIEALLIKMLFL